MSEQIDTFARTLLAVVESSVRARLRAESAGRAVPGDVPAIVSLAARIASLREELADAEALLQRALRTPRNQEARETNEDDEEGGAAQPPAAEQVTGSASGTYRRRILELLRVQPESSWTVPSIAAALRVSSTGSVRTCVKKMCARGELRRVSRGHYVISLPRREKATRQEKVARTARNPEPKATSSRTRTSSPAMLRARAGESTATLREQILGALGAHPKGATAQEVANALGAKPGTVSATLAKLVASGKVQRMSRGWFTLSLQSDASSKVNVPEVAPQAAAASVTARVIETLREHHAEVDVHYQALAEELGLAPAVVRLTLGKLASKELVERRGEGVYRYGTLEVTDDAPRSALVRGAEEIDAPEQLLRILEPVNATPTKTPAEIQVVPAADALDPRRWVIRRHRPSLASPP